ncbi:MAG: glycosyl hydrolase 53 family protein [Anaerolineales bacterium]|nr:glycosyl hydrolase 53 family protein [Anaerolineales bacterium]MCW5886911.1 glycosyl hydrolase 53 family protein [Anaerolineales bacterium]
MKPWAWVAAVLLFAACASPTALPTTLPAPPAGSAVLKGYGISPLGFPGDYSQYPQFLEEVAGLPNGAVMFNGAWRDSIDSRGQPPQAAAGLMQAAAQYGFTPIIVFGWRSGAQLHLDLPTNATNNWSNAEARALFIQMLVGFAAEHHPPYLFLGNENDEYFITQPEDYVRWVEVYNQAYDAIKAASPATQVGPIFQYERMAGLGLLNGWNEAHWGALDAHDLNKVDVVGITLYPWFSVATPQQIPDDYLAPLLQHTGATPIAITETGWPADTQGLQTPWQASPQTQVAYVDALQRILQGTSVSILNWLFINPIAAEPNSLEVQLFGSISLRTVSGDKRPVYDAWVNFLP